MHKIRIEHFSGPMDLLLELLQKNKIDIYDIEISSITEQFLLIMQKTFIQADELSDFIRMASILVQIKVRSLSEVFDEEDEDSISKEELIRRLNDYKLFKKLSGLLRPLEEEGAKRYWKLPEDLSAYAAFRLDEADKLRGEPSKLLQALLDIKDRKNRITDREEDFVGLLDPDPYPQGRVAKRIRDKMKKGDHFSFFDLFEAGTIKKSNLISTFLLVLELSRSHAISISQEGDTISINLSDRENLDRSLEMMLEDEGGLF